MPATTVMFSAGVQVGATLAMDWPMVSRKLRLLLRSLVVAVGWRISVVVLMLYCVGRSSVQCDAGAASGQECNDYQDRATRPPLSLRGVQRRSILDKGAHKPRDCFVAALLAMTTVCPRL